MDSRATRRESGQYSWWEPPKKTALSGLYRSLRFAYGDEMRVDASRLKDEVPRFEKIGTWDSYLLTSGGSAGGPFFVFCLHGFGAVAVAPARCPSLVFLVVVDV